MNKRFAKRIFNRVKVLFGPKEPDLGGFVLNLSADGLLVSAPKLFAPPTRLNVRLLPVGVAPVDVKGEVRWGLKVPPALASVVRPGMGIRLESPPRSYLDYFVSLVNLNAKRADPRLAARLEVRFYHHEVFVKEYTENICRGGLYIVTAEPFDVGDEIKVDLIVPGLAATWPITGRVAYVLDAGQAEDLDTSQGIGVQITGIDPRAEEEFRTYVQRIMRLYE